MTVEEYETEYRDRISRIMAKHEKPKPVKVKQTYKPLTSDEIKMFKSMGCEVTITKNTAQKSLF